MTKPDAQRPSYPLGPALDFLQRLWQLNHAMERVSSKMEKHLGVTAQQRLILRCVGEYPGITSGNLAGVLHLDPGTVSTSLRRLEAKGLLERERDPDDLRRITLALTAQGRALNRRSPGTVEEAVELLLSGAKSSEIAATVQVIDRLTRQLNLEATPGPRAARAPKRT
jgi:MarR family transcriptional regulator, organic hydroperoxide resistance regulator